MDFMTDGPEMPATGASNHSLCCTNNIWLQPIWIHNDPVIQLYITCILDTVLFREQRKFIGMWNAYFQYKTKIESNSGCADWTQAIHISQETQR